ncbi:MAG: hypothetical protein WC453_04035 [Patescibacteria group bacterium]
MKLAVLFWFYKEPDICLNHLQLIKKHNPRLKIFGLFGGDRKQARIYRRKLAAYLDEFYISSYSHRPGAWKWINGDLLILDWYQKQGRRLANWDSVLVIQWDALVLGSLKQQFPGLRQNEIFISGVRRLDKTIERKWHWTKPGGRRRQNYLNFVRHVQSAYGYQQKLWASLFILPLFPRLFFEQWSAIKNKTFGMLEYKIPTYAKIFKIPFYRRDLGVRWFNRAADSGRTPLNAKGIEIRSDYIKRQLQKKDGYRIFHPYSDYCR